MSSQTFTNTRLVLDAIDSKMNDFMDRVLELAIANLIDDGKVDTGFLIKTANINRQYLHKQILFPADYASIVEYGRMANSQMPPPDALYNWVKRKLSIQKESEIKRVSFLIARSISERGIQPSFFLDRAINQAKGEYNL